MTKTPFVQPTVDAKAYNCPFCNAYANQSWGDVKWVAGGYNRGLIDGLRQGTCAHCDEVTLWRHSKLILPLASTSPRPNPDLPEDIRNDYEEARQIQQISPRGSAALLRLCIQKLCVLLDEKGKNINQDIASLVEKGLPVQIQQALDIVRVVGNNAVHPGQIDLNDNVEVSNKLFGIVNIIADVMITQPKEIKKMYENVLPESQREAIAKRDGKE